jgi:hypothetical protein
MWRGSPLNAQELKDLSSQLEAYRYDSILLTFHSESPDYLIKSAAALIPGNKLKYMIALRPYHISPQFCAMVTEGYNQIDDNRLMFNWIAGDFDSRNDEPRQLDVFCQSESINNIVKRTTFLRNFVKEYKTFDFVSTKPEMIFSGFSEYTLETAKMFNGTSLCMIDDYRKHINRFDGIKNRMVCVNPIVLESNDDIKDYRKKIYSFNTRSINTTIVGDKNSVKKDLVDLKDEGVTDILLDTNRPEIGPIVHELNKKNDILVNSIIKELYEERNNV